MTQAEAVRVLVNLDAIGASSIPDIQRVWAHLFIAMGLVQKNLPNPQALTREEFMELAGSVHDTVYGSLKSQEPT